MTHSTSFFLLAFLSLAPLSVADASTDRTERSRFAALDEACPADDATPVEPTCDSYNSCIDSCAEEDALRVDLCSEHFGDEAKACIELADKLYEACLIDCGEPPTGC